MAGKRKGLVVGLGKTGLSCVRFLSAKGVDVTVADSRDLPPMYRTLREEVPHVPVHTGEFTEEDFFGADFIVVSPGIPLGEPLIQRARERGIEIVGDVELFLREIDAPVVAVTGSNGKSTVTALVGDMCLAKGMNVAVAGNIGMPVLDLLREQGTPPDCFVLELSSFQLEATFSLNAQAAAILNLTEDHMDRYASLAEYARAKGRILSGEGVAVVNRQDAGVMDIVSTAKTSVSFGADAPPRPQDYGIRHSGETTELVRGDEPLMPASEVPLAGRHNLLNVLAAFALAEQAGIDATIAAQAVRRFEGLPHRMELITENDGIRWINDSKATNVGAAAAALRGLSGPVILIAGGDGKGADFSTLGRPIEHCARTVVLIGRDAGAIDDVIAGSVPTVRVKDMREAVEYSVSIATTGDTVLLAPACASFDMYESFEARGEHFSSLVRELA